MEHGRPQGGLFDSPVDSAHQAVRSATPQPAQRGAPLPAPDAGPSPVRPATVATTAASAGSPRRRARQLGVPSEWAAAVRVDVSAMDTSKMTALMRSGGTDADETVRTGALSLDNFRDSPKADGALLLDSPHSVQACLRLGIEPRDLLRTELQEMIAAEQRKRPHRPLQMADLKILEDTYKHREKRRRQKLKVLREERRALIEADAVGGLGGGVAGRRASTLFSQEEHKLRKIVEANQAMLRQKLMHEARTRKMKSDREKSLLADKMRDQEKREEQKLAEVNREREAEHQQQLMQMHRELQKREQAALMRQKQQQYAELDLRRREELEEKRRTVEEQNAIRAEINLSRQRDIKRKNVECMEMRREDFLKRMAKTERVKAQFERSREERNEERKQRSISKKAKIDAALERAQRMRQLKVMRALEKEARAEEALIEFQDARLRLVEEKRELDTEKEHRRLEAYQKASEKETERVAQLQRKQAEQERSFRDMQVHRSEESRIRNNNRALRVGDKLENVDRMRKIYEFQKYLTVEKIEEKRRKVDEICGEKARLKEKRRKHRAAIEATRVPIERQTPGPGDYLGTDLPLMRAAPQWKFGVAASHQSMRVIRAGRATCAPGYVASPGPCAYAASPKLTRPKATEWSFSKESRFRDVLGVEAMPGPADYQEDVVPPLPSAAARSPSLHATASPAAAPARAQTPP